MLQRSIAGLESAGNFTRAVPAFATATDRGVAGCRDVRVLDFYKARVAVSAPNGLGFTSFCMMPMVRASEADENAFASRIPHLLLVAGPSGAGKTTFVQQLCAGALPSELHSELPTGTADWDRIEGNRFVKRGTRPHLSDAAEQARRGLIAHYDIVHVHRSEVEGYADDPVFDLIPTADAITVINLQLSPLQLLEQFTNRQELIGQEKGRMRGAWKALVLHPVRRLSLQLRGRKVPDKHDLYREAGWLDRCYAEWNRFVDTLPPHRRLTVEPAVDADGQPTFRLI